MYRIKFKNTGQLNGVLHIENWELDNRFLFLKDKEGETTIINKDEIEMIYTW